MERPNKRHLAVKAFRTGAAMQNRYAIGIDVGASSTKIGLVQAPGVLLEHQVMPSQLGGADPAAFLTAAGQVVAGYTARQAVEGIGISLCSLVNAAHSGALLSVNAPALNNFDIQRAFVERFGCPVRVGNDVAAYALAEYHFGAGRGAQRMLCLALGTGLAIAVILGGQVLETWGGVPADAGRIILRLDAEEVCKGGVRGSAEALCGTAQIERLGRARLGRGAVSAREVILAAKAGDPAGVAVMAEVGGSVGHLLAILSPIFFPQRVVITGGTAEAGEAFFEAIRARYAGLIGSFMSELAQLETGTAQPVEILKGQLGPEAAILGSAAAFF